MERLSDNALDILNDLHTERLEYESEYVPLADALNKLSCYEDITHDADGNEIVSLERLRELVEAEKDGRLVEMDVAIDKRSCDFCTVDGRHRVCVFSVIRKNKISFSDSIVPVFCPVCGEPMKEGAE